MIAAIYARVSKRKEQHAENQLPELRDRAKREGWEIVEYIEGASGKQGGRRPVLAKLLKDCDAKKVDVVLVWKIDRFGRSLKDFVNNVNFLDSIGIRFVSTSQGLDTDKRNPAAKMMMFLLAIFAEFERDVLIERVNAGLDEYCAAYQDGRICRCTNGVKAPGGMCPECGLRQSRSRKNLPPGRPKRIFRRHLIAEMRAQGMSFRAIAKELGVPPPTLRLALKRDQ